MRLSYYTIVVENYPHPQESLLFNTRTQALVKINQELQSLIENYDDPQHLPLKRKYCEDIEQLLRMGLLVDSGVAERRNLESFFHSLKHHMKRSCFQVTILTTYACNFQCVYCFEEGTRNNVPMTFATADQTMTWIKKMIERFEYERVLVTFYGGEPLLNQPILEHLALHLQRWCRKKGKGFKFVLQTNGYLMTPECIDKYLDLGLSHVRVSVDGLADVHNANRPLRGGGETFVRIIDNIRACIDRVTVCISTSYQRDDIDHIEKLLNYFETLGILHKFGDFIFSPVQPSLGPQGDTKTIRLTECMCNYDDEILVSATIKIQELLKRKNLPFKGGMTITACPLTMKHGSVVVDQEGRIFKCNAMLGYPEFAVGDVRDEDLNKRQEEFVSMDVWKQCPPQCPYLPMCSGGCRFMSFLYHKNFTAPVCKKEYLDKVTPEFIKKEFETLAGNSS